MKSLALLVLVPALAAACLYAVTWHAVWREWPTPAEARDAIVAAWNDTREDLRGRTDAR
jgi:ABC-type glycerol-3-phosphate transport system substrate-binding protein